MEIEYNITLIIGGNDPINYYGATYDGLFIVCRIGANIKR
jgi:hypothetical protein